MKTLILIASLLLINTSFASNLQTDEDKAKDFYADTVWSTKNPSTYTDFRVEFFTNNDIIKATITVNDFEPIQITRIEYNKSSFKSGIHANQDSLAFFVEGHDEPVFGLFIESKECLLAPSGDAPEDCLVQR